MDFIIFVAIVAITVFAYRVFDSNNGSYKDPKMMNNKLLMSSIAGQAEWIDKMHRSPFEVQVKPSIKELSIKRKLYIESLCREVIRRGSNGDDVFVDAYEYSMKLEDSGVSCGEAAMIAVRGRLFESSGVHFIGNWGA